MMKYKKIAIRFALSALILIMPLLCFLGCSPALGVPERLVVDKTTLTLTWTPIPHATSYILDIDGTERQTSDAKYSLAYLAEGDHTIKIKARDSKREYSDSSWSSPVSFYKEYESGLVYTLINANTEYEVTRAGSARGDIVIEDEYRGKPVTSIAARAFYGSGSTNKVTIGKNVKTIGRFAFTNCSNLNSVTFGENVESIGESAFQGCRKLTEIVLPNKLTAIDKFLFRYCRNLASVKVPNGVTELGEGAFADCDKLAQITLPDSVATVSKLAFSYCDVLANVNLGGTTELGESAFIGDAELATVVANKLQTIGVSAFSGCKGLASFDIADSVTTVGEKAFEKCTALANVTVGSGVTKIAPFAFMDTALIKNNIVNDIAYAGNWVIGYAEGLKQATFRDGTVGIADNAMAKCDISTLYIPKHIKYIGDYAFYACPALTSVDLGDGVEIIGRYSFASCPILGRGNVRLGSSLKVIDSYAFRACGDLGNPGYANVTIPESVQKIGTRAFQDTYVWKSVSGGLVYLDDWVVGYKDSADVADAHIQEGTIGIANYSFYNSKSLMSVSIPDSVKIIGENAFTECAVLSRVFIGEFSELDEIPDFAFYKCSKLREVDIPVTVKRIGRSAFYRCGIMSVTVPTSLEEIGPYAFYGCSDLINIEFGRGTPKLKKVGEYAFSKCEVLPSINILGTVESIGDCAFYGCTALASVTLGDSLKDLGIRVFQSCTSLNNVMLPDSLTYVPARTFYKCSSLKDYKLGANTTTIGDYAFYACESITSLDLPRSVTSIGNYAFRNCKGLKTVVLRENITHIGDHAFNGNNGLTIFSALGKDNNNYNPRWNSGYRPVVWNCVFATDGDYVVSLTASDNTVDYPSAFGGMTNPERKGYTFVGWQAGEQTYSCAELKDLDAGTVLTAVWQEGAPDRGEEEQPEEQQ